MRPSIMHDSPALDVVSSPCKPVPVNPVLGTDPEEPAWWRSTSAARRFARGGEAALRLRPGRSAGSRRRRSCARRCAPPCPRSRSTRARWERRRCAAPCAGYLRRRFGVTVDPERQVRPRHRRQGDHLPPAARLRGDPGRRKVVMPDPGYPTYEVGARFAGLEPVKVPLSAGRPLPASSPRTLGEATLRRDAALLGELPPQPDRRRGPARLPGARRARRPCATASSWSPTSATPTSTSASRRSPCWRSRWRTCSPSTPARSGAA